MRIGKSISRVFLCAGLLGASSLASADSGKQDDPQISARLSLLKLVSRALEEGDFDALIDSYEEPQELKASAWLRALRHHASLVRTGVAPPFLLSSDKQLNLSLFSNAPFMHADTPAGLFNYAAGYSGARSRNSLDPKYDQPALDEWKTHFAFEFSQRFSPLTLGSPLGLITLEIPEYGGRVMKPSWLRDRRADVDHLDRLVIDARRENVMREVLAEDPHVANAQFSVVDLAFYGNPSVSILRDFLVKRPQPLVSLALRQRSQTADEYPVQELGQLLKLGSMQGLRRLTLKVGIFPTSEAAAMARRKLVLTLESLRLRSLEHLEIVGGGLTLDDLRLLTSAPWAEKLKSLSLQNQNFDALPAEDIELERFASLESLSCTWCRINDRGLQRLTAELPAKLRHLDISDNSISQTGLRAFFEQAAVRLYSLVHGGNLVTPSESMEAALSANSHFYGLQLWSMKSPAESIPDTPIEFEQWQALEQSHIAGSLRLVETSQAALANRAIAPRTPMRSILPKIEAVIAVQGEQRNKVLSFLTQKPCEQLRHQP